MLELNNRKDLAILLKGTTSEIVNSSEYNTYNNIKGCSIATFEIYFQNINNKVSITNIEDSKSFILDMLRNLHEPKENGSVIVKVAFEKVKKQFNEKEEYEVTSYSGSQEVGKQDTEKSRDSKVNNTEVQKKEKQQLRFPTWQEILEIIRIIYAPKSRGNAWIPIIRYTIGLLVFELGMLGLEKQIRTFYTQNDINSTLKAFVSFFVIFLDGSIEIIVLTSILLFIFIYLAYLAQSNNNFKTPDISRGELNNQTVPSNNKKNVSMKNLEEFKRELEELLEKRQYDKVFIKIAGNKEWLDYDTDIFSKYKEDISKYPDGIPVGLVKNIRIFITDINLKK